MNLSADDVHLNILPLFHVGGLFMATGSFHGGALNVNMSKFDAARAVELIEEKKISVMFDFSPILASVLEAAEKSGKDISTLQHVVGLESPEVIEKYQESIGGTFYCMYGQTETSAIATMGRYSDKPGSAGRTIPAGRCARWWMTMTIRCRWERSAKLPSKAPWSLKGIGILPKTPPMPFAAGGIIPGTWADLMRTVFCGMRAARPKKS